MTPHPAAITAEALATSIVGTSRAISEALTLARRVAPTDLPVLLIGATGTGKELFAQEIHRWSGRRGSLVDVNCGAIPRDTVESVLFGHRRGAFTGAHADAKGLIEAADGGTLFLDELPSLTHDAQPKLLRALETGEVRRLGDTQKRQVRVRFIAAAHPELGRLLRLGDFRNDLYHRIAGAIIRLPSLVGRWEDITAIARDYAARHERTLSEPAIRMLLEHSWPGNVRELRMVIDRAASFSDSRALSATAVAGALAMGESTAEFDWGALGEKPAKDRVMEVFAENDWNAAKTAKALGLGRTTFFKELKSLGISLRDVRSNVGMRARRLQEEREL